MEAKTVRLEGGEGRWVELTVRDDQAIARVGDAAPFPFSFENLGYVAHGMGYQAWGGGSHLVFRRSPDGVVVEFQGPDDRCPALCRLTDDGLRATIDALDVLAPSEPRVSML